MIFGGASARDQRASAAKQETASTERLVRRAEANVAVIGQVRRLQTPVGLLGGGEPPPRLNRRMTGEVVAKPCGDPGAQLVLLSRSWNQAKMARTMPVAEHLVH